MLYKKNSEEKLSKELFKNPTCEFRGTPFWAWNSWLEKDELERQIGIFKEMGFGGFFMHTRSGMSTEYLGKEFMRLIRACNRKARENGMLSYLYDEDRWPSGAAGRSTSSFSWPWADTARSRLLASNEGRRWRLRREKCTSRCRF